MSNVMGDFYPDFPEDNDDYSDSVQCQGCGAVRAMSYLGQPHNCFRNEAGELEEGGTFQ
jgi:hypothetical protein